MSVIQRRPRLVLRRQFFVPDVGRCRLQGPSASTPRPPFQPTAVLLVFFDPVLPWCWLFGEAANGRHLSGFALRAREMAAPVFLGTTASSILRVAPTNAASANRPETQRLGLFAPLAMSEPAIHSLWAKSTANRRCCRQGGMTRPAIAFWNIAAFSPKINALHRWRESVKFEFRCPQTAVEPRRTSVSAATRPRPLAVLSICPHR